MKTLDEIFAEIPEVNCRGLCQEACGPIMMSRAEEKRIAQRHGTAPASLPTNRCDKLTNGRCSVYADRPIICRLFGAVRKMKCPHGCTPKRFLSDRKAHRLMSDAEAIAGEGSSAQLEIMVERLTR